MKFPFVSRERLEDAQRQIEKLEGEKAKLLELLVPALKERKEIALPALGAMDEKELANLQPLGRPTVASVIWAANKEAQRRRDTKGKPLSLEVQEKEHEMLRSSVG